MSKFYIPDERGKPVATDQRTWAAWLETHPVERVVDRTLVGDVEVSTVFLGLDCDLSGNGPPLVYETRIFGGAHDRAMDRYPTRDEAVAGHAGMVERLVTSARPS